jgi:hypothetical protein
MEYIEDCNTAACVFGYVGALLADESFELVVLKENRFCCSNCLPVCYGTSMGIFFNSLGC